MADGLSIDVIDDAIQRRLPDMGPLLDGTIDYHFDVFDGKIRGNTHRACVVFGVERYLTAKQDEDYHLRDVRRAAADYLRYRIETYPSDLRANWKPYLGGGVLVGSGISALNMVDPEATVAGIIGGGLGMFFLAYYHARQWRKGADDLCEAFLLVSSGSLDSAIAKELENGKDGYLEKFRERYGRATDA